MKRVQHILAALAATADSIAILDLKGVLPLLPEGWAVWVAGIPTAAAVVVHLIQAVRSGVDQLQPK